MVKIDTTVEGDLATHESFLVVGFEDCVLARVWVEYFLFGLDLTADVDVVDFADVPFAILSDEEEVSRFWVGLLFYYGVSGQITFHQRHAQPLRRAYQLACHFGFPQEEFPILAKIFLNILPPQLALPLKVIVIHIVGVVLGIVS